MSVKVTIDISVFSAISDDIFKRIEHNCRVILFVLFGNVDKHVVRHCKIQNVVRVSFFYISLIKHIIYNPDISLRNMHF